MNKNELHTINQYQNLRMPTNNKEWISHYQVLAIASGIKYEWFEKQIKQLIEFNLMYQAVLKDDPEMKLEQIIKERDVFFEKTGDVFQTKLGFNPIQEYSIEKMWQMLLKKHGRTEVTRRMYAAEIIKIWNYIGKNEECFEQLLKELASINITKDNIYAIINSWTISDAAGRKIAYKKAFLNLENALVNYYKDMNSIETEEVLSYIKMEHVVDSLIMSNRFDKSDPNFSKYQFNYLPEIMLIKLCFSQAIQKTYSN